MFEIKDVSKVKKNVEMFVGSRVRLESVKGRQKLEVKEGIIDGAYPSIFTVNILESKGQDFCGKVSYSYTDVLTRAVMITLCE